MLELDPNTGGGSTPAGSTLSVVSNQGLLASTILPNSSASTESRNNASSSRTNDSEATGNASSASSSGSAAMHSQGLVPLDFIGAGPAVKTLFSIPMADQSVCVAVHNIDGTLLIDEVVPDEDDATSENASFGSVHSRPPHQRSFTSATDYLPPSSQSLALALSPEFDDDFVSAGSAVPAGEGRSVMSELIQKMRDPQLSDGGSSSPTTTESAQRSSTSISLPPLSPSPVREYLDWQFQGMNLLVGSDALIVRPPANETSTSEQLAPGVLVRVEEVHRLRRLVELQQQQGRIEEEKRSESAASSDEETPPQQSYAQAVLRPPSVSSNVDDDSGSNSKESSSSPLNLDEVQLQTCIVPSSGPFGGLMKSPPPLNASTRSTTSSDHATTVDLTNPKCVVLDAYLDNLMANVPQLALCLQEKGLIQSVKLLDREQIPAMMMHPSTLDTSVPIETVNSASAPDLFSPEIMEMNATALLRFLKANCTSNNTTYLLRTNASSAGGNRIQLYDISSISQQRQKKWIWWLATMSYRFALRLRQLESHDVLPMRQRAFRDRQRSLLQTTLDLLQDLRDMDGNAHESLVASVREHMADTFLGEMSSSPEVSGGDKEGDGNSSSPPPVMSSLSSSPPTATHTIIDRATSPPAAVGPQSNAIQSGQPQRQPQPTVPPQQQEHQPYSTITTDALNKAQDHLVSGIKALWPVLDDQIKSRSPSDNGASSTGPSARRRKRGQRVVPPSAADDDETPSPAMVSQLFGLNYKVVNVSLRLAEQYLKQYSSSSAMQALRHAARRMADSISLLEFISNPQAWITRLRLQYIWVWEHCGHFARSFASDELWRDRGHAAGADVLYVLRDVEAAFSSANLPFNFSNLPDPIRSKTRGQISLQSLSAIFVPNVGTRRTLQYEEPLSFKQARAVLASQGQLQRDKREVLVASCISYSRAIIAFEELLGVEIEDHASSEPFEQSAILNLLQQRLGDACNETGKVLLASLRVLLTKGAIKASGLADVLLDSAQFWFLEGLEAFQECGDRRNIALLKCNLCQCCKLRANASFSSKATSDASHAEVCLEKAASHLQAAHETLGQRDVDPMTWDMVSGELAATYLVLAVRRRQSLLGGGAAPLVFEALRLSPGKERSIIEPMEKALAIYQQAGNFHQAAAVHYQLALTNSKIWTCQRDEAKTREKLSAAFQQYNQAFAYFSSHLRGNEPTFVLLCLDIASLYATVSGNEGLVKALMRCLDTYDAFSQRTVDEASNTVDWFEKMGTLASSVDDRVFKLLRSLVKLDGQRWKEVYRGGLAAKTVQNVAEIESDCTEPVGNLVALHNVLVVLREKVRSAEP